MASLKVHCLKQLVVSYVKSYKSTAIHCKIKEEWQYLFRLIVCFLCVAAS